MIKAWLCAAPAALASVAVGAAGCAGGQGGQVAEPVIIVAPSEFVLRDVRRNAARYLDCQVPDVSVQLAEWAGSEGNVTAHGCGYQIHYYLRCASSNQCSILAAD